MDIKLIITLKNYRIIHGYKFVLLAILIFLLQDAPQLLSAMMKV